MHTHTDIDIDAPSWVDPHEDEVMALARQLAREDGHEYEDLETCDEQDAYQDRAAEMVHSARPCCNNFTCPCGGDGRSGR